MLCRVFLYTEGAGTRSSEEDPPPAIVAAVLRAEVCCKRSLALAGKLSVELEKTKMLAACEQVRGKRKERTT